MKSDYGHKRLLLNNDGNSTYCSIPYPITPDKLRQVVRSMAGTDIGILQWRIGGLITFHDSKIIEPFGSRGIDLPLYVQWFIAQHVQDLIRSGHDPLVIVCDEAHRCGMELWPSLRMNDHHHTYEGLDCRGSAYYEAHPELHLPDGSYDWLKPQVRGQMLEYLEETATRYEIDGIDLDYTRLPPFFREEQADEGREAMTDFLRKTRAMLDRVGKQKGLTLGLSAQIYNHELVPTALERAYNLGLDPGRWAKEGLIDILIAHHRGHVLYEPDIRAWVDLVRGTKCKLYAGPGKRGRKKFNAPGVLRETSALEHRAIATRLWAQGADGISFYDYMHHGPFFLQEFREMGDPEKLRHLDKRYVTQLCLPIDMGDAREGGSASVKIELFDDVQSALAQGYPVEGRLLLNVLNLVQVGDLRVTWDGQALTPRPEAIPPFRHDTHPYAIYDGDRILHHVEASVPPELLGKGSHDLKITVAGHKLLAVRYELRQVDLEIRYTPELAQFGGGAGYRHQM